MAQTAFDERLVAGPLLLCCIISSILFGTNIVQTFFYFQTFPRDRLTLKTMIALLLILQFIHAMLITDALYQVIVVEHVQQTSLSTLPMSFDISIVASGVILAIVLFFHTHRVKAVTGNTTLFTLCFFVTTTRCALFLALGILSCINRNSLEFFHRYSWLAILTVALGAMGDINGTILLVLFLWKRRESQWRTTGSTIDKIILWTIQTGATRSAFMVAIIVCIASRPINLAWTSLLMIAPGVYINSLLATLNGRSTLSRIMSEDILCFSELGPFSPTEASGYPCQIAIERVINVRVSSDHRGTSRSRSQKMNDSVPSIIPSKGIDVV